MIDKITEQVQKGLDKKLAKKKQEVIKLKWEKVRLEEQLKQLKQQKGE